MKTENKLCETITVAKATNRTFQPMIQRMTEFATSAGAVTALTISVSVGGKW